MIVRRENGKFAVYGGRGEERAHLLPGNGNVLPITDSNISQIRAAKTKLWGI